MEREKGRDLLKRIHKEYDVIPSVHNYCDRWCERCRLSHRCSVYLMEFERERVREERNLPEPDFVEEMADIFADTMEMIREMAEEQGINLDDLFDDEEVAAEISEKKRSKADVRKHYLYRKADEHSRWFRDWFQNRKEDVEKLKEILNADANSTSDKLSDPIEVLLWFQHFIAVKFARALDPPFDDSPEAMYDNNGSAKIAIIAVDRCIQAISTLLPFFPEDEDQFLTALVRLTRIRKRAIKEFPDAMDFKRPGFDD